MIFNRPNGLHSECNTRWTRLMHQTEQAPCDVEKLSPRRRPPAAGLANPGATSVYPSSVRSDFQPKPRRLSIQRIQRVRNR